MYNKILKYLFFISLFGLIFTSCQKEELIQTNGEENENVEVITTDEDEIVLGEEFNDPFAFENMKKAYKKLQEEGKINSKEEIEPTHLYVKFLPENFEDLDILEADKIPLYDYPLNYEIVEGGTYYSEPEIQEENSIWLYSVVDINYKFSDIPYEIIYEVYIPTESEDELEKTAFEIAGLSNEINLQKGSRYTPSGVVEVWNTIGTDRLVGVNNVKVETRYGTKFAYGYTNSSGSFSVNKQYRYKVHFKVIFKNSRVKTWRYYSAGKITIGGSRKTLNYDIYRGNNEKTWTWATTVNAVADYYSLCNQLNINTPPTNLKISTTGIVGGGACPMLSKTGTMTNIAKLFILRGKISAAVTALILQYVMPDIILARATTSDEIYRVLYHELSHASHYTQVGKSWWRALIAYEIAEIIKTANQNPPDPYGNGTAYNAGYCAVAESWAMGMEDYLRQLDPNITFFVNDEDNFDSGWIPKGIYFDLWDADDWVNGGSGNTNTIREMFLCLIPNVKNMNDFENRFTNQYGAGQEQNIEDLFNFYGL